MRGAQVGTVLQCSRLHSISAIRARTTTVHGSRISDEEGFNVRNDLEQAKLPTSEGCGWHGVRCVQQPGVYFNHLHGQTRDFSAVGHHFWQWQNAVRGCDCTRHATTRPAVVHILHGSEVFAGRQQSTGSCALELDLVVVHKQDGAFEIVLPHRVAAEPICILVCILARTGVLLCVGLRRHHHIMITIYADCRGPERVHREGHAGCKPRESERVLVAVEQRVVEPVLHLGTEADSGPRPPLVHHELPTLLLPGVMEGHAKHVPDRVRPRRFPVVWPEERSCLRILRRLEQKRGVACGCAVCIQQQHVLQVRVH